MEEGAVSKAVKYEFKSHHLYDQKIIKERK